jgi:hypothetical protein
MPDILNQHFHREDLLGTVRLNLHRLIYSEDLDDEQKTLLTYLDTVMSLNLLTSTNRENYIGDHIPGQPTLDFIEKINSTIVNPYLKTYLLDILQVNKRKKYNNAQLAITGYFTICGLHDTLSAKRDYLLRIIQILKGLGKGNKAILKANFDLIKKEVLEADILNECFSITHIITAIIELEADPREYDGFAELLQSKTDELWAASKFQCYRYCNDTLARLLPERSVEYGTAVANAYIAEADEFNQTSIASQYIIADLYKKALRIFKVFGSKGEEIEHLAGKVADAQQKAVIQQMGNNLPPERIKVNSLLEFPEFENIYLAVYWLVALPLPSKSTLENDLSIRKKSFLHQHFLGSTMADAKGNIIAVSGDNTKQIYIDAKLTREIYCKSVIIPMYNHFSGTVSISEIELAGILYGSKFIPPERLDIYTRGLYLGFCGNFVEAVHLLVPQIENGLKTLLNKKGKITRKLNQEIQTEKNLQYFLDELQGTLDGDLLFDLDGLLNEAFGENLRHDLAHGLCETARLTSYLGLYTWWLALKISLHIEQLTTSKEQSE